MSTPADLYAPPDVEPGVVACLSQDADVWVGTRFPSDGPGAGTIRVSATGGPRPEGLVAVALTVLVECWHDDAGEASRIARRAWARLDAAAGEMWGGVEFKHVSSTGLNNNPDVNRPRLERFQFLTTIHSRLIPLEAS